MGDPAGIGPELISRIWYDRKDLGIAPFIYVGAKEALLAVAPDLPITEIMPEDLSSSLSEDEISVIDIAIGATVQPGHLDTANGSAVVKSIESAVGLAQDKLVSGIVTAPIHKEALYQCGFDAPGHTEYLARLCDLPDNNSVMMLATEGLRVVPVTVHIPLSDVPKKLTADRIVHAGLVVAEDLRDRFGIEQPKIAVAGLNPHAGEGGTIGMEEGTHIMPAVWTLRDHGIDVAEPSPADTLFHAEARANYDAVLCMYHDQALIPLKTLDFWGGVNITLGLPFIRTSPDHGTALPLAGKGVARMDSMIAAIKTAAKMAQRSAGAA